MLKNVSYLNRSKKDDIIDPRYTRVNDLHTLTCFNKDGKAWISIQAKSMQEAIDSFTQFMVESYS
jgi:hypothetical protein